jgi:membrane protease YdiL (CAAX protease family)
MRRKKASLLVVVAVVMVVEAAVGRIVTGLWQIPSHAPWTPRLLLGREALYFAIVLSVTLLLGLMQGRSLAIYGFPLRYAFGGGFWEGAAWGLGSCAAIYAVLAAVGCYTVRGFAVRGAEAVRFAGLWALAMLAVAVYEELYFRGFPLFTLSCGLGFWPAAILLSLYFGGLHYLGKPNETLLDLVNVALIGLFFCFTVRRTGDVWFGIGWHFSFNYGSLAVFGSPNSGNDGGKPLAGRLLEGVFTGPDWLTGGPTGAQASVVTLAVVAALFAVFHWRHREQRYPAPARRQ